MDLNINEKVALVTGAGRGLGRAIGLALAREGCRLALCDINKLGVEEVAEEIVGSGGKADAYQCDIAKPEEIDSVLKIISSNWKPVDILVNNAAVLDNMAPIEKMKDELWLRDVEINLTGTYYVTKACFPAMKAQNWGRVVSMSSTAGAMGGFGQASYSATKGGVTSLMKTVALEGGRYNVTANSIVAGIIRTPGWDLVREDMQKRLEKRTPLNRPADPDEIAEAIVFLCSEKASYITGVELYVTGGIHLFTF